MSWTGIEVTADEGEGPFVVARPAFVVQGYGDEAVAAAAETVFDRWLEWAGRPEPLFYLTSTAKAFRELTAKQTARVRADLRNAAKKPVFYGFKNAPEIDAGTAALELRVGAKREDELANSVYAALPAGYPTAVGPDAAVAAFTQWVGDVPFGHATAGYGFNLVWGREWEQEAMPKVMAAARRYLGLDVRERTLERLLLDRMKGPGWLTYLGPDLLEQVGGADAVAALPAEVERIPVRRGGVVLRAGKAPPVGDVNRRAPDLAPLRTVAALLRPVRVAEWDCAPSFEMEMDEANAWFARLDP